MRSGDTLLIDVRDKAEWSEEHIPDTINLSRGTLELVAQEKVPDVNQRRS
jgi:rhodanese-related sulfurtransferase